MMTCGQRAGLDFIVVVLAGVDGDVLTIFLFALLLRTGMKLSSDESSSDIEYSSVSSVSLAKPTRFFVVEGRDDFWPGGPLACSASMAARRGGKCQYNGTEISPSEPLKLEDPCEEWLCNLETEETGEVVRLGCIPLAPISGCHMVKGTGVHPDCCDKYACPWQHATRQ